MTTLTAEVWDGLNTTKEGDVTGFFDASWNDELSDIGSGRLTVLADNAIVDSLYVKFHIRFILDGEPAFTWRIDKREFTVVTRDEEAKEVCVISGPGIVAAWGDAIVYPVGGTEFRPTSESRPFTWASVETDDSDWDTATVIRTGASTQMQLPDWSIWPPRGWPSPVNSSSVSWIWSRALVDDIHPAGYTYYRKSFTLEADAVLVFFFTADDRARLFLDGILLHDWTDRYPTWSLADTFRRQVKVTAGTHVIGIEAENYDFTGDPVLGWSEGSPGGVLCAVHERPDATTFSSSTLIVGSDATWKCLDYPEQLPAPTIGAMLTAVTDEAQDRTALPGWTFGGDFSEETDSAGNAWDTNYEYVPRVGSTLLSMLRALAEDRIDFRADPVGKVLYVWNKGASLGTGPTLTKGTNLVALERTEDATIVNHHLVRYADGWRVAVNAASADEYLRIESMLSVAAVEVAVDADAAAEQSLSILGEPKLTIVGEVWPASSADTPYDGWTIGETVTLSGVGNPTSARTVGFAVTQEGDELSFRPTFEDPLQTSEKRVRRWLERASDGTLQGRSSVASLASGLDNDTPGGKLPVREKTFSKTTLKADSQSGDLPSAVLERVTMLQATLSVEGDTATTFELLKNGTATEWRNVDTGTESTTLSVAGDETRATFIASAEGDLMVSEVDTLALKIVGVGTNAGRLTVSVTLAEKF